MSYLKISLSLIMRFTSWINAALMHTGSSISTETVSPCPNSAQIGLTLFADEGIIAIVRIVRISYGGTATIAERAKVEF